MARTKWIDPRRATSDKIDDLNKNVRQVEQWARQAEMDKSELDALYTTLGVSRRFSRSTYLGASSSTYTNWTHVKAFGGYSIWKYPVSNYTHNTGNMLWVESPSYSVQGLVPQVLEYQGQATAEGADYFDHIYTYDGSSYSSDYGGSGGELSTEGGTPVEALTSTSDYIYVGSTSGGFEGVAVQLHRPGAGLSLKFEYWNGSAWTQLTSSGDSLTDWTSNFTSDGRVTWTQPDDWSTTSVNSTTAYWLRISTTTSPTQTPTFYRIYPPDTVESLLLLSWTQIRSQDWGWCYYNNYVYVTIPNSGPLGYEGRGYITSSSSSANKQNFFTVNHRYAISYELSTWKTAVSGRSGSSNFNGTTGTTVTHNLGHTSYRVFITLTEDPGSSYQYHYVTKDTNSFTVYTQAGVTSAFEWRVDLV